MSKKFKNSVEFANTKLLLENYRNIQIAINCRGEDEIFSQENAKNFEDFCECTFLFTSFFMCFMEKSEYNQGYA